MADINSIVLPDGTEYPISDYYIPVAISNPTNGQVLKYDATNQVWYNGEDTSGSSVFYGTSAPTSQLGTDGNLYVKYTEGTGGASDTVDALYVKLDGTWCQISTGGGGGTSDYNNLTNKPQINSVELSGNKSLDDLGIQPSEISKTATGSIVTFSDGGDNIPVESFECEIVAQQASGTPTPASPLPITGFSQADISVCGKNLFNKATIVNNKVWTGGGEQSASGFFHSDFIKVKPNTTYYSNSNGVGSYYTIYFFDSSKTLLGRANVGAPSAFTTTADAVWVIMNNNPNNTPLDELQLTEGNTAQAYSAYNGNTYIVEFGQTIYGGKLVYANGKWFIRATHGDVDLGALSWSRYNSELNIFAASISDKANGIDNILCEEYDVFSGIVTDMTDLTIRGQASAGNIFIRNTNYATTEDFVTSLSGVKCVYELATPLLIPLTSSAKIKTLPGVNNIFSNTGDSTLKYFTNDADGIEELINTSETSAENTKIDDTNLAYEADNVQEAFEKIIKYLTYAEYQALSEEEKNNGTAYFITDVNGDGQNFQPVIYSEEEREIGVWIDGKPLYEKTIVANVTQNQFSIDVSDLHIDNVVVNDGFIVQTNGNIVYIPYGSNYNDYALAYYNNNYIKCAYAGSYNTTTWHIRIRYTKTTDVAGSGTWTPQGVPAHHYSTDEQIVGTWIDGKPLYEKTIKFNNKNVTAVENTSELVHGISDIDTAFVHEAYADFNGTEKWATAMNVIDTGSNIYSFEWVVGTSAIYLKARNLSFSPSTDRSYLFVIRYTKSS